MVQIWTLEPGCTVSSVRKAEFNVRNKGVSTVWAVARGHYTKMVLVRAASQKSCGSSACR